MSAVEVGGHTAGEEAGQLGHPSAGWLHTEDS